MKALVCVARRSIHPLESCWRFHLAERVEGGQAGDGMKITMAFMFLGIGRGIFIGKVASGWRRIDICNMGLWDDSSRLRNQQQLDGTNPHCLRNDWPNISFPFMWQRTSKALCVQLYEPFPCSSAEGLYLSCQDYHPGPFNTKHLFSVLWGNGAWRLGLHYRTMGRTLSS